MTVVPESHLREAQDRNVQLRTIITSALIALDEGRYGDVRRLLSGGSDKGLMTETGVIAKDGGGS